MTIEEALKETDLPGLEKELLLGSARGINRAGLLKDMKEELSNSEYREFGELVKQRKIGKPVAYILGEKEFYGRTFKVDERVLIPRPSTEGLIDLTKNVLRQAQDDKVELDTLIIGVAKLFDDISDVKTLVDIGTGSGCIAITLALEFPEMKIIATDISPDALDVARENAQLHNVSDRIEFREGESLDPIQDLTERFLIVSNPPYIPEGEELMKDVKDFEPHLALFSGKKGTDVLEKMIENAKSHPQCTGMILELRSEQIDLLKFSYH